MESSTLPVEYEQLQAVLAVFKILLDVPFVGWTDGVPEFGQYGTALYTTVRYCRLDSLQVKRSGDSRPSFLPPVKSIIQYDTGSR